MTDGGFVQGEQSPDRSCQENPPPEPSSGAVYEIATGLHHFGDPAVHAAADVERLLADAPALQHIVDLAARLAPDNAARGLDQSDQRGSDDAGGELSPGPQEPGRVPGGLVERRLPPDQLGLD